MPARATRPNPYPYDPRAEARAEQDVYLLLGQGDPDLGRDLYAWWASWFLPEPPAAVRNGWAGWTPRAGWRRYEGSRPPWKAILAHFRGEWAVGGVYLGASRIMVLDADNRPGKDFLASGQSLRGRPIPVAQDLGRRAALLRQHQPHGYTFVSGPSGGYHRITLLAEPVPHELLVESATQRFLALGAAVAPGSLEILPSSTSNSLGGVIRAPFGPGSFLLDEHFHPAHRGPGQGIRLLRDLVQTHGPTPAVKAFPGIVLATQESLPTESPRQPRHITVAAPPAPPARLPRDPDWVGKLHRVSGLTAPEDRLRGLELLEVLRAIDADGIPRPGLRRACTWAMAYHCRLQHLGQALAERRILDWLDRHGKHSRDYQADPEAARQDTREIVGHVYRDGIPKPRKARLLPAIAAASDQYLDAALRRSLGNDGELVAVARGVLGYVRENGSPTSDGMVWRCRIPFAHVEVLSRGRVLTLRNRRLRDAFDRLLLLGLLRYARPRIPKRFEGDPRGARLGQAREYRFYWTRLMPPGGLGPLQVPAVQSFSAKTTQLQPEGLSVGGWEERETPGAKALVGAVDEPKARPRPSWARVVPASTGPAASTGPQDAEGGERRSVGGGPGEGARIPSDTGTLGPAAADLIRPRLAPNRLPRPTRGGRQLRLVWSAPGWLRGSRRRRLQGRSDDGSDGPG